MDWQRHLKLYRRIERAIDMARPGRAAGLADKWICWRKRTEAKVRPDGNAVGARMRSRGWKPAYYPLQTIVYSHPTTSKLVEVFLDGAVRLVTPKSNRKAWNYTKDFRGHTLSEM